MTELKLPSLGEGIESGSVVSVLVQVGDTISKEQILIEVETDKVVVEVPADAEGVVEKILVTIGDEISEGAIFIQLNDAEGPSKMAKLAMEEQPEKIIEVVMGETPEAAPTAMMGKNVIPMPVPEPTVGEVKNGKVYRTTPLARKLAREIGIDIRTLVPKSDKGRIGMQDVKDHARILNRSRSAGNVLATLQPAPLPDFSKWGKIHTKTLSGIERATGKNMTASWSEIPHAWLQEKVDITKLEAKRKEHKEQVKAQGGSLTLTSILVKVVAKTLEEYPVFNTSLDIHNNEIIYKEYINIGVAVDSERGLLVPVIRNANQKGILEISKDLAARSQEVRDKKAKPEDLMGGTFTISNLGGIGASAIFPLVNHSQVAILGVASGHTEAVWVNGALEPRLLMPLTIGFDHRVINGADAARFLQRVKQLLEDWFLWSM